MLEVTRKPADNKATVILSSAFARELVGIFNGHTVGVFSIPDFSAVCCFELDFQLFRNSVALQYRRIKMKSRLWGLFSMMKLMRIKVRVKHVEHPPATKQIILLPTFHFFGT